MWNKSDWTCAAATGAIAFGLTLAAFGPDYATAKNPTLPIAEITRPALEFGQFRVTAWLMGSVEKGVQIPPGKMPKFRIEVKNNGDTFGTAAFSAEASGVGFLKSLSRVAMPRSATPQWIQPYTIDLKPRETKVIDVSPDLKIGQSESVTVQLSAGKQTVSVLTIGTSPDFPSTQPEKPALSSR
jgi:hypothetical protein